MLINLFLGLAFAATLGGVEFTETKTLTGKNLLLNGLGMREATIFKVDVYAAGLYLEKKNNNAQEILSNNETKYLEMFFVRDVGLDKIVETYQTSLDQVFADKELEARTAFLSKMKPMTKGKSMALMFTEKSVDVLFDGQSAGVIENPTFARGLLEVWLGQTPPNPGLKTGLLGI
ncbi:MAG: chalcone isomerase family protein [Bacteriovoracaceae bacterium]|nr:chalcone isomerase family protein [Bacteriovoracaceae bacterium]